MCEGLCSVLGIAPTSFDLARISMCSTPHQGNATAGGLLHAPVGSIFMFLQVFAVEVMSSRDGWSMLIIIVEYIQKADSIRTLILRLRLLPFSVRGSV